MAAHARYAEDPGEARRAGLLPGPCPGAGQPRRADRLPDAMTCWSPWSRRSPVLADREWDRFPAYMRSLVGFVRAAGVSFLATSETVGGAITSQSLEGLMFLFDNVIGLRHFEERSRPRAQRRQDAEPRARDDREPGHHHRRRAHSLRQARRSHRTTRVERATNPRSALSEPPKSTATTLICSLIIGQFSGLTVHGRRERHLAGQNRRPTVDGDGRPCGGGSPGGGWAGRHRCSAASVGGARPGTSVAALVPHLRWCACWVLAFVSRCGGSCWPP